MATNETESTPRVRKKRERMRREILDAARALLLEEGPDAVTLGSVSGRLGMTKPALYHYFPSKEALTRSLVAALIDDEVGELEKAVERAGPGENPIASMIRAFHAHYRKDLHAFRFVYGQSQLYLNPELGIDAAMVRNEITPRHPAHWVRGVDVGTGAADNDRDCRGHGRSVAVFRRGVARHDRVGVLACDFVKGSSHPPRRARIGPVDRCQPKAVIPGQQLARS
jgi:AcrR family transcriptional regulator